MPTPLSSSTAYCTAAQFLLRNDARRVGELLLDIGAKAESEAILSGDTELPESSVVLACLKSASGEVESACLVGERYDPTDLAALTGNSAEFLASIVSDLAMWGLLCRRKAETDPTPRAKEARAHLERLRQGQAVFGLQEQVESGDIDEEVMTAAEVEDANLASFRATRLFGNRGNRLNG